MQLHGLLDLALACALGAIIGVEREVSNKPAGLRTHVLAAAAVALFVIVGQHLAATANENLQPDPVRILEAIATGISFLGAGTIIFRKSEGVVEGLTTATSLLLCAAIAMTAALELYVLAIGVTLFALVVLRGLRAVEAKLPREKPAQGVNANVDAPEDRRDRDMASAPAR